MSQTIARRYAQALYEKAVSQNNLEQVDADVVMTADTLAGSRELVLLFRSPVVNREKKEAVVKQLFAEKTSPAFMNLLLLLLEKGREEVLGDILQAYRVLRNEQNGVVEAEARVAYAMDAAEQAALKAQLETLTGKQVHLTIRQDEKLVGGAVVRVGDVVYDGSIRTQLNALRERLLKGGSFLNN